MQNKGLTLIELMVVIAIIAVIASIAVPAYTGYVENARMTEGANNLSALKLAQEEYFLENNTYFSGASIADLEANSGGLWKCAEPPAKRNFTYEVVAGSTGAIATSYSATATGFGKTITVGN